MSEKQPGPCELCGATDYPLSMGGPAICPACDCGGAEAGLRARLSALEAENKRLADDFRRINTLLHAGILIRTDAGTVTRVAQIVSAAIDRIDAAQAEGRNA